MNFAEESVLVEYAFTELSNAEVRDLPQRVNNAVETLVTRDRLPSDEDVRELVREAATNVTAADANDNPTGGGDYDREELRVRVLLPHSVALHLAMHRSFHEEQPSSATPLSPTDVRILTRRSRRARLRAVRQQLAVNEIVRRSVPHCVVCMEKIQCRAQRLVLECMHEFHRNCIVPWLGRRRICPICRTHIDLTPRLDETHLINARRTRASQRRAIRIRSQDAHRRARENMNTETSINFLV